MFNISNWHTNYRDAMDIIVNERNVFRKARSCLDHNYMLVSAIKNRINIKLDTFCAFIDLRIAIV